MSTITNSTNEYATNSLRKKPSLRRDGSYRIFHITKKQKEESDDDDNKIEQIINNEKDIKRKYQKKSFKISNRNGLDGWKRKSTKNKRLLFLPKTSSESTTNEIKTLPSSYLLTNDLSSSTITSNNNTTTNELFKKTKQTNINELTESDNLIENINQTINHDDDTLNDLLARAVKLETTVQKQEFIKIQPLSRTSVHRRRKRFIITCSIVLIAFTVVIAIVIFIVIMTLKYKKYTNQISKSSPVYDPH